MANPLLVFRVGYMKTYDGIDEIVGGGAYVEENGEGGEMWNFRYEAGRCYGFVMTKDITRKYAKKKRFAGINLKRIDPTQKWRENESLPGVDIVYIAKHPDGGQVVIGWYRNATVFHKAYRKRRGRPKMGDWAGLDYLCEVDADDALLVQERDRDFRVPHGKGFIGQSNVWYPDEGNPEALRIVDRLRKYIGGSTGTRVNPTQGKRGGKWSKPNKDLVTQIEQAAVALAEKHYKQQGYAVKSVERDNRGWDIEVRKGKEVLYVEVKGHIGNVIQFELTPNEYLRLQEHHSRYRVCVLRNATSNGNELEIYAPKVVDKYWVLQRLDKPGEIRFNEQVAAKAFEAVLP
ncbi:hypothetical protein RHOFW510R12_08235 [Rhodanobacter sp. FW510-R12]|nr:MAG: DUF3883 domain-containing protein [Rhodanobacter sp.]